MGRSIENGLGRDGRTWERIHRHPYIVFGPEAAWDECGILVGRPFAVDDRILIYYTGLGRTAQTPGAEQPKAIGDWNIETGLATQRLDGFVSLDARAEEGMLVTEAITLDGTGLCVNANADGGQIVVDVLDNDGRPLEGITKEESKAITGDRLRAKLTWTPIFGPSQSPWPSG